MRKWLIFTFGAVVVTSQPVWAETSAGEAMEALSMSLTWIIAYLGVGALLMAIATAVGIREHRAWSTLLNWEKIDAPGAGSEPADADSERPDRAA